ncbi:MAG: hypothetical protein ABIF18_03705 [archaeon]
MQHNKKEGGKVVTTYLGKSDSKKNYNQIISLGVFFLLLFLGLFFIVDFSLTGKVSLSLEESYEFGERIEGSVKLSLKQGELIPVSTKILVDNSGEVSEFLLNDLVSYDISEGNFYVENIEISGTGEGYGILGEKIVYPNVSFILNILSKGLVTKPDKPEKEIEEVVVEEIINESVEELEEIKDQNKTEEEIIDEPAEEQGVEEEVEVVEQEEAIEEVEQLEQEVEDVDEEEEPAEEESEPEIFPLTGAVISESILEIEGVVSKDNSFSYDLPNGRTAEIKESSQDVELSIVDSEAIVTTEYFEIEQGFGEDYLVEETFEFSIDLSKLNLTAQKEGNFIVSLIYNDSEIVSVSKVISIEGELEIPVIEQNLTEENITIRNETLANESVISIIEGEMNLTTIQYGAVLNKPVKWKKNIKLTQPSANLSIEIPAQAENISVFVISKLDKQEDKSEHKQEIINESVEVINETIETNESEVEEPEIIPSHSQNENGLGHANESELRTLITAEVVLEFDAEKFSFSNFFKNVFGTFTGRVIETEEGQETKEVFIEEDATEFEIEYETPAPYAIESNISNGKRITIASDVHYENILAYTVVEDSVPVNSSDLKLYWYASYEDALAYDSSSVQESVVVNVTNESVEENVAELENTTEEINESYFSVLTGNVIANETLENISEIINETNVSVAENYSETIKIQVPYVGYDLDEDGYVDYIEWVVPHLSNQTYELVIEITKAEHLDENRSFISDIYDDVKALDGNWSEVINDSEYVRVTFEQELDNTKDITVYARSVCAVSGDSYVAINGTQVPCDIYQKKKRIEEIRRLLDG